MAKHLISFLITLFVFANSYAKKPDYCQEYGLGWNFYCQDEKAKEKSSDSSESLQKQEDYAEKLEHIKKTLENKKAKAVVYPTEENIKDYMSYQQIILDKSSAFSDQWRRVLWKTPSLDYTLRRPVSKVGKESWIDQRNKDVASTISHINDRYGVFFLFSSTCPHCHRYSPILKSFKEKYGITIMPVSMDGGALPDWEEFMIDTGQIARMGITSNVVPQTVLFDKETRKIIPVGSGVLSHSDLEERIYAITELEVGSDF